MTKHKKLQIIEIQREKPKTFESSGITKKSSLGRHKHFIASSPIRRLMIAQGGPVNRSAVDTLIDCLEYRASELTKQAIIFTLHAKRKKITKEDMKLAIKYF